MDEIKVLYVEEIEGGSIIGVDDDLGGAITARLDDAGRIKKVRIHPDRTAKDAVLAHSRSSWPFR